MATKKSKSYNQDALTSALRRIKNGELSIHKAATAYQIPRSTLQDKLHLRSPLICSRGPSAVFTQEDEERIARWTVLMDKLGLGQTMADIQNAVKYILDSSGRTSLFRDNLPRRRWISGFRKRHPGVVVKRSKPGAEVNLASMDKWFTDFAQYLEEVNVCSILEEPARLFTLEESSFYINNKKQVLRGNAPADIPSDSQITVLVTVNARGSFPTPLIVMPYHVSKNKNARTSMLVQTENGTMDSSAFLDFLTKSFKPFLIQEKVPFPVLLWVNEKWVDEPEEVAEFCSKNSIILYPAPPHAACITQVPEISVAGALNAVWDNEPERADVTISNFRPFICKAWKKVTDRPSIGIEGFKTLGIHPFSKSNIIPMCSRSSQISKASLSSSTVLMTYRGESVDQDPKEGIESAMVPPETDSTGFMRPAIPGGSMAAVGTSANLSRENTTAGGNRTTGSHRLVPVQVSSTAAQNSVVFVALDENGTPAVIQNQGTHQPILSQSRDGGIHCPTCTCPLEETCQIPKEMWKEFCRFMKKRRKRKSGKMKRKKTKNKKKEKDKRTKKSKKTEDVEKEKGQKTENVVKEKGQKRSVTDGSNTTNVKRKRGQSSENRAENRKNSASADEDNEGMQNVTIAHGEVVMRDSNILTEPTDTRPDRNKPQDQSPVKLVHTVTESDTRGAAIESADDSQCIVIDAVGVEQTDYGDFFIIQTNDDVEEGDGSG